MDRSARSGVAILVCLAVAVLVSTPGAAAQLGGSGYCAADRHEFDPTDLRPAPLAPSPRVRLQRMEIAGIETPVFESGPAGAGEAIVFLHGNPGSSQDWLPLLLAAGRYGRTVAFDLPGFGRASKPREFGYDLPGYTRWLAAALDRLAVRWVHLVVHDLGGPPGMQWAVEHPGSLRSAVIIDSGVLLGYRHHTYAQLWRAPGAGELSMLSLDRERFHQAVQYGQVRPLPRPFVDRMYDDFDRGTRCAVLDVYRSTDDPDSEFAGAQAAALRPLDRPALVIWGRHDPYLPPEMAERQREAFPSARVEVFDQAAHWPFIDEPERVERLVVPFLRDALARRKRPQLRLRLRRAPRLGDRALKVTVGLAGGGIGRRVRVVMRRAGRITGTSGRPVRVVRRRTLRVSLRRPLTRARQLLTVTAANARPATVAVRPRCARAGRSPGSWRVPRARAPRSRCRGRSGA